MRVAVWGDVAPGRETSFMTVCRSRLCGVFSKLLWASFTAAERDRERERGRERETEGERDRGRGRERQRERGREQEREREPS